MRNKRWNPALRHTVLGEPGNDAYLEARSAIDAAAYERKLRAAQADPALREIRERKLAESRARSIEVSNRLDGRSLT